METTKTNYTYIELEGFWQSCEITSPQYLNAVGTNSTILDLKSTSYYSSSTAWTSYYYLETVADEQYMYGGDDDGDDDDGNYDYVMYPKSDCFSLFLCSVSTSRRKQVRGHFG